MHSETFLANLPAAADDERLVVYLVRGADGSSKLSLRQQNWAEGIGWYDQKTLDLEPAQLRMLRSLGAPVAQAPRSSDAPATLPFPARESA